MSELYTETVEPKNNKQLGSECPCELWKLRPEKKMGLPKNTQLVKGQAIETQKFDSLKHEWPGLQASREICFRI